jgi:oligopeptide transport system substrate-binding protein
MKDDQRDLAMKSKKSGLFLLAMCLTLLNGCNNQGGNVEYGNQHQILHAGNGAEPQDLDPHITTGIPEYDIQKTLFEGLAAKNPRTLEPIPGAAESWTISPDGKLYTFMLRKNARWSNGDPVTAHDFVYSWKRILSAKMAADHSYMLYCIDNAEQYYTGKIQDFEQVGVKALNDHTLQVRLKNPTPFFLQLLDHHSMFPVHQPTIEKFGAMDERGTQWTRAGNLVGNGPFKLKTWEVNKILVVEKNPNYWDTANIRLQQIHFHPIEDLNTEERMFRTGQIHLTLAGYVAIEKIATYKKENPELIHITPGYASYYYEFNTTRKPFDDVRVRRALAMAIDRQQIVDKVAKGGQLPAYALTPPDPYGYQPKAAIEYDVTKARSLLAAAGYADGKGFPKFELLYNTAENHQKIATAIQQMWKTNLNINAQLSNQEWKVYINSRNNLEHDIARAGWLADYVDPSNFLDILLSYSGNNRAGWKNVEYDRLLNQAAATADSEARYAILQQAEQLIVDEVPVIPIYYYSDIHLVANSVRNWQDNIMKYHPFNDMYLSTD